MILNTLFISNRDDISIEYLISKLRIKSISYIRINSEDIDKFSFNINPQGNLFCKLNMKEYDLSNVKSVVFRRVPSKFNFDGQNLNSPYLSFERKHFLEGLYLSLQEAKWINPMFATHIAERKVYQLRLAFQLGLQTPKSVITNNIEVARNFLMTNKEVIIKPISNGLQVTKEGTYSIYTTQIANKFFDTFDKDILLETPVFLQERIENEADIRVTIVGNKVFAVRIEKIDSDEVDWRKPEIEKKYSLINLPTELEKRLVQLNRKLNLVYSAIDLIQTPDKNFIFLEVNPVGEWVWLEQELNIDISGELIKQLI